MILNSGSIFPRRSHPIVTLCCASTPPCKVSNDQLRDQLDHLHKEADSTRRKSQSSRLRLMRLSEAAEKLRRQAAVSVRNRNENEARELLFQKNRVMQAIEKSKERVELLDELAAKLYEAISLTETQLIGNIAKDLEISSNDPSPVHIVSPNEEDEEDTVVKKDEHSNLESDEAQQKLQVLVHSPGDLRMPDELVNGQVWNEVNLHQGLKETSFENFLEHLDLQLSRIEAELVTYLNFSTLDLGDKEKPDISKVQKSLEILHSIRQVRARIERIKGPMQTSDEDLR